jgi:LysM repeat protein
VGEVPAYSRVATFGDGRELATDDVVRLRPKKPECVISYETYAAVRGDSYWAIARRFGVPLNDLLEANGAVRMDVLRVGQKVQIPVRRAAAAARSHVVRSGDTLSALARHYGVSVADLRKINDLPGDSLVVGQCLFLPVGQGGALLPPASTAAGAGRSEYVVRRGDTLSSIAANSAISIRDIMDWNGIVEPNRIREGQRIILQTKGDGSSVVGDPQVQYPRFSKQSPPQKTPRQFDEDLLGLFDDVELFSVSR